MVEDDPSILMLVGDIFESRGYRVLKAKSGTEGIMTAMNSVPDIVIADINMPSGYGSSLYHTLQADKKTKHIPFIFITGIPVAQAKKLIPDSLGVVLLLKPFDVRELVKIAEDLLSKTKSG